MGNSIGQTTQFLQLKNAREIKEMEGEPTDEKRPERLTNQSQCTGLIWIPI